MGMVSEVLRGVPCCCELWIKPLSGLGCALQADKVPFIGPTHQKALCCWALLVGAAVAHNRTSPSAYMQLLGDINSDYLAPFRVYKLETLQQATVDYAQFIGEDNGCVGVKPTKKKNPNKQTKQNTNTNNKTKQKQIKQKQQNKNPLTSNLGTIYHMCDTIPYKIQRVDRINARIWKIRYQKIKIK